MFRFLLKNSRKVQKATGAGCCVWTVWLAKPSSRPWFRKLVELCFCLYGSVFLKHESLDLKYGKTMNFAFQSHTAELYCFQSFFKEAWILNKPKFIPPVSAKSPWDGRWVGSKWPLGRLRFVPVLGKASEYQQGPTERMVMCPLVLSPWVQAEQRPHSRSHSSQPSGPL